MQEGMGNRAGAVAIAEWSKFGYRGMRGCESSDTAGYHWPADAKERMMGTVRERWTEREVKFLQENWGRAKTADLARYLRRAPKQITNKGRELGLTGNKEKRGGRKEKK